MNRNFALFCLMFSTWLITPASAAELPNGSIELKGKKFDVEIANDDASRERGLMFRDVMSANHGMLFLFPAAERQTFWMKNTHISLDIFYFDADRKLVNVQERVPPCLAKDNQCPVYPSSGPAKYVLELNAGSAEKLGVKPGDELTIHR